MPATYYRIADRVIRRAWSRSPELRPPFPRLSRLISTTSDGSWIATTSTVWWRCLPTVWWPSFGYDQTTANRRHRFSVGSVCAVVVPSARLVFEERRNEVAALGSEFQHASIGHHGGGWGYPIDRVCRPLLGVCLGRRKNLALTTAVAASAADAWSAMR